MNKISKYFPPCSFCNKPNEECEDIIESGRVQICNKCIQVALEKVYENEAKRVADKTGKLMKPKEIYKKLNAYVIGQERAKKKISTAIYSHFKRITSKGLSYKKSNILMAGPTGSGKTYLLETVARSLDVPFIVADVTSITKSGYVGSDTQDVLLKLLTKADGDKSKAERGIIYIDEVDKIASRGGKGVGTEAVQQELLKMLEGHKVTLTRDQYNSSKGFEGDMELDTSNILFICGGAFVGLDEIVADRLSKGKGGSIGFSAPVKPSDEANKDLLKHLIPKDLEEYGMLPEFIGRLPSIVSLDELTEKDLMEILTIPKDNLYTQFKELLAIDGIELVIRKDVFQYIAKHALERKNGARGLRSVIERVLEDVMFEVPNKKRHTVTLKMVKEVFES